MCGHRAAAQEKRNAIARLKQELENIKERAQQVHMEKERKVGFTKISNVAMNISGCCTLGMMGYPACYGTFGGNLYVYPLIKSMQSLSFTWCDN